jgi:hypothetical protein
MEPAFSWFPLANVLIPARWTLDASVPHLSISNCLDATAIFRMPEKDGN